MDKVIAQVSVVPVRAEPSDKAEIVTQMLYGESAEIIEMHGNWRKIKMHIDGYEGWVDVKQLRPLSEEAFLQRKTQPLQQPFKVCALENGQQMLLSMGSELQVDDAISVESNNLRSQIATVAEQFLNVPYLWGGRSFFGIDCSGFIQVVYKVHGINLPRDAYQQAEEGRVLDFIEESQAGDLAFFENEEGKITHVGLMLDQQKIIHAHGKVRIDALDSIGIFNQEQNKHTHKLRFIKSIL
ncbi:C40 family peptidase [Riemerella columbina]|uniref:C40 family peptidase n=1 Tax=Riemerella columbina TaxID=103810 RepID=UPI00266EF046|nr:C40 family peptidase [Riemerella columbina]WKS95641.1 C40 family peptidase [Riemerella columbina]